MKVSLQEALEDAIKDASEACLSGDISECAVAWDIVEELSAASAQRAYILINKKFDPLEEYCEDDPSSDECRTYDL